MKILRKRYLVFSMPYRQRIENSVLYRPYEERNSFSRSEEIWIIKKGIECKTDYEVGGHYWIDDSFELEPTDLNLWPEFQDKDEFKKLKELCEMYEGKIKTQLILESSILVHDPEYQCGSQNKLGQFRD